VKKEISKQSRQELISAIRHRYSTASKEEKARILDEFVAMTGYHRKHAIRVLGSDDQCITAERPCGKRIYNEAIKEALIVLWEASDRICGKRLKAILPILIEAMEHNSHLDLDTEVKSRLLQISSSTIDRLLASIRQQAKGWRKKRTAPKKASKQIPLRTFADWEKSLPGELEIDFVVHCGDTMAGACIHSLVGTDVCSGWTEAVPLLAREQSLTTEGLDAICDQFPVPVIGLNPDNDGAFINDTLLAYCQRKNLKFTRSRPYQKNDQAWVEQKNGAVIRRFVGYERFSGIIAGRLFGQLYQALRLYVNYFQPSFKLLVKRREGAKVKRLYSKPMTPADRLLVHSMVSEDDKEALRAERSRLDPIKLLHKIRDIQAALADMASPGYGIRPGRDLDDFLSQLPKLWKAGEVRPTHRKPGEAPRCWRTRPDPFEDIWPQVLYRLGENPDASAKSLFEQLIVKYPGKFQIGQLRTLQRRVKEWRYVMARELVYACNDPADDSARRG
jgi:predicted RNA-binding protein Jag